MPSSHKSDAELMKAYQMGDSGAFEILYHSHSTQVFTYLKRRLPKQELAEECFQLVFAKFHHSRHLYNPTYSVQQWIYVIARTTLTDFVRKQSREVPIHSETNIEELPLSKVDIDSVIENADTAVPLDSLPSQQRKVIELRVLDELSYKEIAELLGQSESNMRQAFGRGIKKLKSILNQKRGIL